MVGGFANKAPTSFESGVIQQYEGTYRAMDDTQIEREITRLVDNLDEAGGRAADSRESAELIVRLQLLDEQQRARAAGEAGRLPTSPGFAPDPRMPRETSYMAFEFLDTQQHRDLLSEYIRRTRQFAEKIYIDLYQVEDGGRFIYKQDKSAVLWTSQVRGSRDLSHALTRFTVRAP